MVLSFNILIDFKHILGAESDIADRILKKWVQSAFLGPGGQNGGQIMVTLQKSLLIWSMSAKNLNFEVFFTQESRWWYRNLNLESF